MRRSLFLVPFAVVLVVAGCHKSSGSAAATSAPRAAKPPADVTPARIALGDSLFHNGSCQRCHGATAAGAQNGPSLIAGPWLHSTGKFEEIAATITTGVPRTALKDQTRRFPMNPRGGPMNLTDEQVKALAAYIYSISREKTPRVGA